MQRARKHKIGKRERAALEIELKDLEIELERLNQKDEEGFELFYYDAEANHAKVERRFEIEAILARGFYCKIIEVKE